MKQQIILRNIGRNHVTETIDVPAKAGGEPQSKMYMEALAYAEVRKHLLSSNVEMLPASKGPNTYLVTAGFHTVGEVEIKGI